MRTLTTFFRNATAFAFAACIICFTKNIIAQTAPAVGWSKCYGGSSIDILKDVAQDAGGNYLMCGWTISNDGDVSGLHGVIDVWVVKTDHSGNLLWQKSLGGSKSDLAYAVAITPEGGCMIVGTTDSNDGDVSGLHGTTPGYADAWVVKLDANGNMVWQRCWGSSGNDGAGNVIATTDGNYLLSGHAHFADGDISDITGEGDAWLVKFDGLGNILWEKTYGGTKLDNGGPLCINPAGGFSICGRSYSRDGDVTNHHGNGLVADIWVFNVDEDGNLLSEISLGGSTDDYPGALHAFPDGSLLVAGQAHSNDGDVHGNHGTTDVWLVRLSAAANIVWDRCYGSDEVELVNDLVSAGDGGFYLVSSSGSADGDVSTSLGSNDFWIVKIDSDGNIIWDVSYGGSESDQPAAALINAQGNLLIGGNTKSNDGDVSNNHGQDDFLLIQTAPANSIATSPISASEFCPGSKLNVSYTITGVFAPGNIFTAQLSDESGDFDAPYIIGSVAAATSGTISCKLPAVPDNDQYRIRVVSSNPVVYGTDNGESLSIGCPKPENLSVNNITATSAALDWDLDSECKVKFIVKYRSSDMEPWTKVNNIIDHFITLNGLTPATSYSWNVKTQCTPGSKSKAIKGDDFNTGELKTGKNSVDRGSGISVAPNPVSEIAIITFPIEADSWLTVELLNMHGIKIKTIAAGNFEAGSHQLQFERENLSPGIYLLQLQSGSGIQTQKLTIQ